MTDENAPPAAPAPQPAGIEQPVAEEPRLERVPEVEVVKRRGLSVVWLVPLIAAAAGCWLAYQSFANRGIPITITFKDAEGIEAGKTRVKCKAVDIGVVDDIRVSEDLEHAVVSATIDKEMEPHLTVKTRFWVVRPRVDTRGVSGLSTVISGAYIETDSEAGPPKRHFAGEEKPVVNPANARGLELVLHAKRLGSLDAGSPIFHCDIKVGKVLECRLADGQKGVVIDAFIDAPYQDRVRTTSRFWNASGFDASLSAAGLSLKWQSLATLVAGGVAFDTPDDATGEPCAKGARFDLYEKQEDALDAAYTKKLAYVAHFEESVRGLSDGAPVVLHGKRVGTVTEVSLEFDPVARKVRIPVFFDIEPGRVPHFTAEGQSVEQLLEELVQAGLRAQVSYSNVLTGQLLVDLDFNKDAPAAVIRPGNPREFPTVPSTLLHTIEAGCALLDKLQAVPLDELVSEMQRAMEGVDQLVRKPEVASAFERAANALEEVRSLALNMRGEVEGVATAIQNVANSTADTLLRARELVIEAEGTISSDSPLMVELLRAIEELGQASRSIRRLADYLENHPEALIQGKKIPGG